MCLLSSFPVLVASKEGPSYRAFISLLAFRAVWGRVTAVAPMFPLPRVDLIRRMFLGKVSTSYTRLALAVVSQVPIAGNKPVRFRLQGPPHGCLRSAQRPPFLVMLASWPATPAPRLQPSAVTSPWWGFQISPIVSSRVAVSPFYPSASRKMFKSPLPKSASSLATQLPQVSSKQASPKQASLNKLLVYA